MATVDLPPFLAADIVIGLRLSFLPLAYPHVVVPLLIRHPPTVAPRLTLVVVTVKAMTPRPRIAINPEIVRVEDHMAARGCRNKPLLQRTLPPSS